jgi:hypothetical protein
MGTVIVSRLASSGMVAAGVYLLDVFCLGLKNSFASLLDKEECHQLLSKTRLQEPLKKVEPASAAPSRMTISMMIMKETTMKGTEA